jgi:hypothetical protein
MEKCREQSGGEYNCHLKVGAGSLPSMDEALDFIPRATKNKSKAKTTPGGIS